MGETESSKSPLWVGAAVSTVGVRILQSSKFQAPNPKEAPSTKLQNDRALGLDKGSAVAGRPSCPGRLWDFETWSFFGVWGLEPGALPAQSGTRWNSSLPRSRWSCSRCRRCVYYYLRTARTTARSAGCAGIGPRHTEGDVVKTFDGFRLQIKVERPVARSCVNVAVNRTRLDK